MKRNLLCVGLSLFFIAHQAIAQNVGINATGAAPHTSAILDVSSTTKGVLFPRMTTAQRNAIASPAEGLMVYNTDCKDINFYNGTTWISMLLSSPAALSATGITSTQFTANWTNVPGATAYFIDVSTNSAFSSFVINNLNVGNVTTYNVTGLSCGITYYYRVRAVSSCGTSSNSNTIVAATTLCCGPVQRLVATAGSPNSNSWETPYSTFWHDSRRQYIITAAELNAAGFCAGDITAMQLNVSATGSPCMSGFTIKIKNTASTTLGAYEGGTVQVYTTGSHCPAIGWNNYVFSSPHYWDGTSSILVEICFDNSSYSSNYTVFCETVSAGQAYGGYTDGISGACTYVFSNTITNNIRPVFRLNAMGF